MQWTADILQDFELLLSRRATGEQVVSTRQDLLNVADWRETISQHRYRTPTFVRDRTVVDSVSVQFSAEETNRLIGVCGAIGRRQIGDPQLRRNVRELCDMLQELPRVSTRKAIKQGLSPYSPNAAGLPRRVDPPGRPAATVTAQSRSGGHRGSSPARPGLAWVTG